MGKVDRQQVKYEESIYLCIGWKDILPDGTLA